MIAKNVDWELDNSSVRDDFLSIQAELIHRGMLPNIESESVSTYHIITVLNRNREAVSEILEDMELSTFDLLCHNIKDLYNASPAIEKKNETSERAYVLFAAVVSLILVFIWYSIAAD